jgi:hypothetical protein
MSYAEQLGHQGGGSKMNLVFHGMTAISLGVVTTKVLFDMIHEATQKKHRSGRSKKGRER